MMSCQLEVCFLSEFWILITELHFEFRFALFWSTVEYHLFQFFLHYEYVWRMCRVKFLKLNQPDRIIKYKIAYKQWDASVLTNYQTDKMPLSALKVWTSVEWFIWLVFSSARFMNNWVETFTTQFILLLWVLIMRSANKAESIASNKKTALKYLLNNLDLNW